MRYIVFSLDPSEEQAFADMVEAPDSKSAEALLLIKRPYAVLDQVVSSVEARPYLDTMYLELEVPEAELDINHLDY